jgi:hypothetical protein
VKIAERCAMTDSDKLRCGEVVEICRGAVRLIAVVIACAFVGTASTACAQSLFDRDANVGVLDRPRPEYQALGVNVGGWTVYPKLTLESDFDDNIYATQLNRKGDFIFEVDPELVVQSNWNRNFLSFNGGADISSYADHSREDTVQYNVGSVGRLDVLNDLTIDATAKYSNYTIPRTQSEYIVDLVSPLQYDEALANLSITKTFNRFAVLVSMNNTYDTFSNGKLVGGGIYSEQFNNNDALTGTVRLNYAVSPKLALFTEEDVTNSLYTVDPTRNSISTSTLAGVNFQLAHLVMGEVSFGYITSNYSYRLYHSVGAPNGRVQIKWFPTELITVTVSGNQAFVNSGIVTSPAYLAQTLQIQADYELLRNLIITGQLGGNWDEYRGIDRRDQIYSEHLAINYLLNRTVGLGLRVSHTDQLSYGVDRGVNFNDDTVALALTLQR